MIKSIVYGNIERYSTDNFSHHFEVRPVNLYGAPTVYYCDVRWNNRRITTGSATTRIDSIRKALNALQQTAYKLPFADYRMADVLTGQI